MIHRRVVEEFGKGWEEVPDIAGKTYLGEFLFAFYVSYMYLSTNTPKYSLFDAPRTAEIDRRVLKIIADKLGCWYQEGDTISP